jgi:hypothetical protein
MTREIPFFIEGVVYRINDYERTAYVKHRNGNIYHVFPFTPGIIFSDLKVGDKIAIEITSVLTKVYSARIIRDSEDIM